VTTKLVVLAKKEYGVLKSDLACTTFIDKNHSLEVLARMKLQSNLKDVKGKQEDAF